MRRSHRAWAGVRLGLIFLGCGLQAAGSFAQGAEQQKTPKEIPLQSLFFSDVEIAKIHEAMSMYLRGQGQNANLILDEDDYFNKASEAKQQDTQGRYYTYPQFFLESLVFHSDIDWSVWINGQKISHDSEDAGDKLKVRAIDKDKVDLEWAPSDMAQVIMTAEKWPNEEVTIDRLNGTVLFTLKPNQTFSSYVLRVLEGKVLPVIIDSQPAAAASLPQSEPAATPGTEVLSPTQTDEPIPFAPAPSSTLEHKAEEVIELFEQK